MSKEAFILPGQGSQYRGMGTKLVEHPNPEVSGIALRTYQESTDVLDFNFMRLCTADPEGYLFTNILIQPALLATSIAHLRILAMMDKKPDVVAGHSAGQYAALVAAGVLSFQSGLELIFERGRLMDEAARETPGGMLAIIGLPLDGVERICLRAKTEVANLNQGQTVIAGRVKSINKAFDLALLEGARVFRLGVGLASHCSLMQPAAEGLRPYVYGTEFLPPQIPFIQNTTGGYATTIEEIRTGLIDHLTKPVQWQRTMEAIAKSGAESVTEVGPGRILTKMSRRANPGLEAISSEEIIFNAA